MGPSDARTGVAEDEATSAPGAGVAGLRVAIAHDWLVSYAGSERCVEELLAMFPDARLLTTVMNPGRIPGALARAEVSLLQRIPGAARHYEKLIPLIPAAWRLRRRVDDVDLVISSSHACAKAVRVAAGIPHLCYCHTPMRYAWEFELERERFPAALRPFVRVLMAAFRRWDRRASARVTEFVANSTDVSRRIADAYGRTAHVVHPPVDTGYFTPGGTPGDHFVYVGRLVAYKRADLVVEAFRELPHPLKVIGTGPLEGHLRERATPNIDIMGRREDGELRDVLRTARAFVFPAHEDFGITMAESLACGTPVIGLARGGAADIVDSAEAGILIEAPTVEAVRAAVGRIAGGAAAPREELSRRASRFSRARFRDEMAAICLRLARGDGATAR